MVDLFEDLEFSEELLFSPFGVMQSSFFDYFDCTFLLEDFVGGFVDFAKMVLGDFGVNGVFLVDVVFVNTGEQGAVDFAVSGA